MNCGDNIKPFPQSLVWFSQPKASAKFYDCTFTFDIESYSSPVVKSPSSDIVFDSCTFNKCPVAIIESSDNGFNAEGTFQFTNNVLTSANQRIINILIKLLKNQLFQGTLSRKTHLILISL